MIPEVEKSLAYLSTRLITKATEKSSDLYDLSNYGMTSMLIEFLIKELANGIEHRYRDIVDMQQIFRQALQHFPEWQQELEELSFAIPEDLTLAGTNRLHDRCTWRLMAIHERVEREMKMGRDELASLDRAIWRYLAAMAERHRLT